MHNFADTHHGRLPPAVVYGSDGKPLLSWRVLILPYVDQEELFKQFKLDEPWDSPHNLPLLDKMPHVYAPPPGKMSRVPPCHTVLHVFVGPGTAFDCKEGCRLKDDFPDGLSNTIMVIEAGKPVPWTKPEELPYDPAGPLPELPGLFHDVYRIGLADGSSVHLRTSLSEATLRALITRNGGDKPGPDY
jgi:hypothetical protein